MKKEEIKKKYAESMYRRNGFHTFMSDNETFSAKIVEVQTDGQLELVTKDGEQKYFYFKEVQFVI